MMNCHKIQLKNWINRSLFLLLSEWWSLCLDERKVSIITRWFESRGSLLCGQCSKETSHVFFLSLFVLTGSRIISRTRWILSKGEFYLYSCRRATIRFKVMCFDTCYLFTFCVYVLTDFLSCYLLTRTCISISEKSVRILRHWWQSFSRMWRVTNAWNPLQTWR